MELQRPKLQWPRHLLGLATFDRVASYFFPVGEEEKMSSESSPSYSKLLGTSAHYFCERRNTLRFYFLPLKNSEFTADYSHL